MPGIGIISNPHAGINRRDPEHNTLVWYVLGNRGQFEVTSSPNDLQPVCEEFFKRGIDHIGVIGGDGTICLALQSILKVYGEKSLPRILVMRGGTMNVVAGHLGIYGKPANIMGDFLDVFHSGKPLTETVLRTMKVNGKLGFVFGNGAAARFLTEFYKTKKNPTQAGIYFAKVIGGGVFGRKLGAGFFQAFDTVTASEPMQIETLPVPLAQTQKKEFAIVFASTISHAPLGFTVCHQLKSGDDSRAELVALSSHGRRLVFDAARVIRGASAKVEDSLSRVVFESAKIRVRPGSLYTVDGELYEADTGEIQIELGPRFVFCSPYGKVCAKTPPNNSQES